MRNLVQRVSTNNCVFLYGLRKEREVKTTIYLLKLCMGASNSLTPSEEAVLNDFSAWYDAIDWSFPYSAKEPAWFYCNLNEGYNLLVQAAVPCEGSVTDGVIATSQWRPGRVKMV